MLVACHANILSFISPPSFSWPALIRSRGHPVTVYASLSTVEDVIALSQLKLRRRDGMNYSRAVSNERERERKRDAKSCPAPSPFLSSFPFPLSRSPPPLLSLSLPLLLQISRYRVHNSLTEISRVARHTVVQLT